MAHCLYTNKLPKHGSSGATLCAARRCMCTYDVPLCGTICHNTVPPDAPLALLMAHESTLFALLPTNEPANEPTKTQGIDERTHRSGSNRRTNPSLRKRTRADRMSHPWPRNPRHCWILDARSQGAERARQPRRTRGPLKPSNKPEGVDLPHEIC
jgi:hypothetical protein